MEPVIASTSGTAVRPEPSVLTGDAWAAFSMSLGRED